MSTETTHAHPPLSAFARRPVLTGSAVGVGSLLPHVFMAPQTSLAFAAVLMALIAGIYFGFAVVNGSPRDQFVEFSTSGLFTVAGLLGLLHWPVLLPLAYLAHAGWDFAHHHRFRLPLVTIPRWYPPWCAVIDLIIGVGLIMFWTRSGVL